MAARRRPRAAPPGTGIEPSTRPVTPARPNPLPYHAAGAAAPRFPARHARAAANQRRAGPRGGAAAGVTAHAWRPGRARSFPGGRVEGGGGGDGSEGSRGPGRAAPRVGGKCHHGQAGRGSAGSRSPRRVREWTLPGLVLSGGAEGP